MPDDTTKYVGKCPDCKEKYWQTFPHCHCDKKA